MDFKYHFPLESLLKLKQINEQKIKIELGIMNKSIQKIRENIFELQRNISGEFQNQDALLRNGVTAQWLQHFPEMIQVNRQKIKKHESEVLKEQFKYEEKIRELAEVRNQCKVLRNMEDSYRKEYKRKLNKYLEHEIEDLIQMGNRYEESKESEEPDEWDETQEN